MHGITRVNITLGELYAGLLGGDLEPLHEGLLKIFSIDLPGEISGLRPIYMFLPERNFFVTTMLGAGTDDIRTQRWSERFLYEDMKGIDSYVINNVYRPARISKKNVIGGVLYSSIDPYRNDAKDCLSWGRDFSWLLPSEDALQCYLSALEMRIKECSSFMRAFSDQEYIENTRRWDFMFRCSWARAGDRTPSNRKALLDQAISYIKEAVSVEGLDYYSDCLDIHPASLVHADPINIFYGYKGSVRRGLDDNDGLWDLLYWQLKLICHLKWPIFYSTIKRHGRSSEPHKDSIERWLREAPPSRVSMEEVKWLVDEYLRHCEANFPSLTDCAWDELASA